MYFRATLEVGKKKKDERIMFIAAKSIVDAMDVTRKIRWSRLMILIPVTHEDYMKGVDKKYTHT